MKRKRMLTIISCFLITAGIGLAFYAYRNMTYEQKTAKQIKEAQFKEKQVHLPDGSILNYGEGPDKGEPLVLLHGQQVSWEDYAKVLGELSQRYHIYAVDYYGHGGSSKDPAKYSAVAIGQDIAWFIDTVIQESVLISGHSSGGLIAAWVAANEPGAVKGLLIEDAPFFSTEKGRAESTFAWLGFKDMADFLASKEENFTRYSLEHSYMAELFGGQEIFDKLVKNPALRYMKKHPQTIPKIWYYPPELKINEIYTLTANLQDGTGEYDLQFGLTFYDFSWFNGFDQEETLKNIQCPSVLLHAAKPTNMEDYYDDNGILLSAMDDEDAKRVDSLLRQNTFINHIKSGHDIHADKPEVFIKAVDQLAALTAD
ncbi:alpha/beta hydrolase [Streptococcus sp. H31]|uniref:alpha/beta hydrolase n=1 Tax=Streptococcus huangxiaojuni TaxID=3237239 RepID=UPI0034A45205